MSAPRRPPSWCLALLAGVTLAVSPAPAAESSRVVYLEATGAPEDVAALEASLKDWLRAMQLELRSVATLPEPGVSDAFARVRVAWSPEACTIDVYRPAGPLVRSKALPLGGPPLLVIEAAALVAQAGVQELSVEETRRRPLPTPEGPPRVALPVEPEPPSSPFRLAAGAYLQGRSFDGVAPVVVGGGAELTGGVQLGAWRPGASLLLAYQGPVARDTALASLQVQAVSLRVGPTLWRQLGPVSLSLGLGGGADLLIASTSSNDVPSQFVRGSRVDLAPFATAWLGVSVPVAAGVGLSLRALLDVDPARRRYLATVGGERTTLLEPWAVRPALQLGVTFDLLPGSRP